MPEVMDKLIIHVRGKMIISIDSLIKFIAMLSKPISILSCSFASCRNIELTSFGG